MGNRQMSLVGVHARWAVVLLGVALVSVASAQENVADQRMKLMQERATAIKFDGETDDFPTALSPTPLFRYDDVTRGYVDGAVWRLGERGRPAVIITTELHKNFFGDGPKIIYEFLSLTDETFVARSGDFPGWMPQGSEMTLNLIKGAPVPAETSIRRLQQMKLIAKRFTARQNVERQRISLRRLPQPIGRYGGAALDTNNESSEESSALDAEHPEGAMFVFASGRMPGLLLLIENDGKSWFYGVGRLSRPSELVVSLDGLDVWSRVPSSRSWSRPYTSTNATAKVP